MIARRGEKRVRFEVVEAQTARGLGFDPTEFSKSGNAACPSCGTVADIQYIKDKGWVGKPEVCTKTINFFCTDNRDGEAKLVLVEKYEGREMNPRVFGIPVSRALSRNCERVTVTLSLDEDLILRAFGKGATQERGASDEYHDLHFALDTRGTRA
jgi:hypothetical protein